MAFLLRALLLFVFVPPSAGWLGVVFDETGDPLTIAEVVPDSPAQRAGLRAGDVLLAVDDVPVPTPRALGGLLGERQPGDRVRLTLQRGKTSLMIAVVLAARPAGDVPDVEVEPPPPPPRPVVRAGGYLGVRVVERAGGVEITDVVEGGPAAAAGLRPADVLQRIDGRAVETIEELRGLLAACRPDQVVAVTAVRGQGERHRRTHRRRVRLGTPPPPAAGENDNPDPGAEPADRARLFTGFMDDLTAARAAARQQGRPLLVVVAAPWAAGSRALSGVLTDPEVAATLRTGYATVWISTERYGMAASRARLGEEPQLWIEGVDGRLRGARAGRPSATELLALLRRHASGKSELVLGPPRRGFGRSLPPFREGGVRPAVVAAVG